MSEAHFQKIYQEHSSMVRAIIFRSCGPIDLDDLVQETFVKIFQNLDRFKGESNMKTWIYKITLNTVRDYLRSKKRRRWLSFFGSTQTDDSKVVQREAIISSEAFGQFEAKHDIHKLLETLSAKLRETVILYSINELSIEEISKILDIPEGTVKSRINLAKNELASAFARLEKKEVLQ